jgi:NAD(P)-dependent dehydrogenase (short-subunit alcohol dehydrogenase family)
VANSSGYQLKGAHGLVTGGGRGIGASIARALDDAGVRVSVLGRTEAPLKEVLNSFANKGTAIVCDVTDEASVSAAIAAIQADTAPIDILVNNAGAAASAPFAAMSRDVWDNMLSVNLTSVYLTTRAVIKDMQKRKSGRIVNIASTAGLKGYPYVTAYTAAKHGVVGLTRALALELAQTAITVNAICPGYTDTELLSGAAANISAKTGQSAQAILKQFAASNPQNRLISPAEVASAVVWLCSRDAAGMTGQALSISGGEVM